MVTSHTLLKGRDRLASKALLVRNKQISMLVLDYSLNSLVVLSQFAGVLNIQLDSIEFQVILMIPEQETLLDLDHLGSLMVLLNLSPSIQMKEICSSPLLELAQRVIQKHILVLEELETLLMLRLDQHLIMLVLVVLVSNQENQMYMSYVNSVTSLLISIVLEMDILTSVIFTSLINNGQNLEEYIYSG